MTIQLPGFTPVGDSVTFASAAAVHRTFVLDRLPQVLDTVTKSADATGLTAGMRQLERRRESGMGRFLTSGDLRKVEHRSLPSLLAGFGGTNSFNYRGYTFLASSRGKEGFSRELPRAILSDSRSPRACWVQVFVDGMRIYGIHEGGDAVDVRRFLVKQLEGVEYYRGPAETPAELSGLGAVCGTLVLWTRQ